VPRIVEIKQIRHVKQFETNKLLKKPFEIDRQRKASEITRHNTMILFFSFNAISVCDIIIIIGLHRLLVVDASWSLFDIKCAV